MVLNPVGITFTDESDGSEETRTVRFPRELLPTQLIVSLGGGVQARRKDPLQEVGQLFAQQVVHL